MVSRLWSPNSDQLWNWMRRGIVGCAGIAAKDPTLMGVFLNFENYEPPGESNYHPLSYYSVHEMLYTQNANEWENTANHNLYMFNIS